MTHISNKMQMQVQKILDKDDMHRTINELPEEGTAVLLVYGDGKFQCVPYNADPTQIHYIAGMAQHAIMDDEFYYQVLDDEEEQDNEEVDDQE